MKVKLIDILKMYTMEKDKRYWRYTIKEVDYFLMIRKTIISYTLIVSLLSIIVIAINYKIPFLKSIIAPFPLDEFWQIVKINKNIYLFVGIKNLSIGIALFNIMDVIGDHFHGEGGLFFLVFCFAMIGTIISGPYYLIRWIVLLFMK